MIFKHVDPDGDKIEVSRTGEPRQFLLVTVADGPPGALRQWQVYLTRAKTRKLVLALLEELGEALEGGAR